MDRRPRVAVVLVFVLGLVAVGPSAGVGVVADSTPAVGDGTPPATVEGSADDRATPGDTAGDGPEAGTDATADADPVGLRVVVDGVPNRVGVGGGRVESGFASPRPDLGASLSAGDGEFRGVYVAYLVRGWMADADTDAERRAVVREALDLVERRVEALRTREAVAIRSYHNGSIDRGELLRRLASIDTEAGALRASLTDLEEQNPFVTGSFQTPIISLDRDLRSLEGPVRDRVARAFQGSASTLRVHVTASESGLALEMVDRRRYVRETVRMDHYAPGQPPQFNISMTTDRLHELYPGTISDDDPVISLDFVGDRAFLATKSHSTGRLTLYLDRSTGEVYREVQRLRLGQLPNTTVTTATGEELKLVVNRTDAGNPYRIRVVDPLTEQPVDARVGVAGQSVGRTGPDGVLWTLGPEGQFNVSASAGDERINVTVGG